MKGAKNNGICGNSRCYSGIFYRQCKLRGNICKSFFEKGCAFARQRKRGSYKCYAHGFLPGILTFVCDALKGFLASYLGKLIFGLVMSSGIDWLDPIYGAYLCGIACMLGHVFPIYFQFKGGKGAATSVGIYAVCCPLAIILGLCAFALVLLTTKIVSLGSLAAALTVVVLSIVFFAGEGNIFVVAALSITMGTIVFAKHKDNIKRLVHGEEKKLTLGGEKNG